MAVVAHLPRRHGIRLGSAAPLARWTGQGSKRSSTSWSPSGRGGHRRHGSRRDAAGSAKAEPSSTRAARSASRCASSWAFPTGSSSTACRCARQSRRCLCGQAPSGDRHPPAQLPADVLRPQPQPGRPHRRRPRTSMVSATPAHRWVFNDQPLVARPRAVGRCPADLGGGLPQRGPPASTRPSRSTPASPRSPLTRPTSTASAGRTSIRASSSRASGGRSDSGSCTKSGAIFGLSTSMTWDQEDD